MARARKDTKSKKPKVSASTKGKPRMKGKPRTVRLTKEDETWVNEQPHPQGFTGVLSDAIRYYREHKDAQRQALLEAVA